MPCTLSEPHLPGAGPVRVSSETPPASGQLAMCLVPAVLCQCGGDSGLSSGLPRGQGEWTVFSGTCLSFPASQRVIPWVGGRVRKSLVTRLEALSQLRQGCVCIRRRRDTLGQPRGRTLLGGSWRPQGWGQQRPKLAMAAGWQCGHPQRHHAAARAAGGQVEEGQDPGIARVGDLPADTGKQCL